MYRSVVDIHSATAKNRRGKKKKEEEETTRVKYNGLSITIGGHNEGGHVTTA